MATPTITIEPPSSAIAPATPALQVAGYRVIPASLTGASMAVRRRLPPRFAVFLPAAEVPPSDPGAGTALYSGSRCRPPAGAASAQGAGAEGDEAEKGRAERGRGRWSGLGRFSSSRCCSWPVGCRCGCRGTGWPGRFASRLLCAASLADGCGDEPGMIARLRDRGGRAGPRADADARLRAGLARLAGRTSAVAAAPPARTAPTAASCPARDRRSAADRLRPRRRLPGGRGRDLRSRRGQSARGARRRSLHPVLVLLRRLGDPPRVPGPATPATTRTTGSRVTPPDRPGGTVDPRASSHHGYNYELGASPTGARTPASGRSTTSPEALGARPPTAGARRPARCPSPAAATPATPPARHRPDRLTRPPRPPDPAGAARRDRRRLSLRDQHLEKQAWRDPEATVTDRLTVFPHSALPASRTQPPGSPPR